MFLMYDYELVVVGAGSAGLVGAKFGGRLGFKVALVEKRALGGDCTWMGCVPSKALLHVAKVAHAARIGAKYGIQSGDVQVDMKKVRDYVHSVREAVYKFETPEEVSKANVDVFLGDAKFTDPNTLKVTLKDGGEKTITGKKFIIATGASAAPVPVEGLDTVEYQTYETLFENDVLPERLITIGGGPIGSEMSQAYSRLGSKVTIISSRILKNDEPEAGEVMHQVFESEGITVNRCRVMKVEKNGSEIVVHTSEGQIHRGDMLLVAVGRAPSVGTLNLEAAGVEYTKRGIPVNENLLTNQEHIYAAGDIVGGPQFTHYAGLQGSIAARNALLPLASKGVVEYLPWATFTSPEVAHVGMLESQAREIYGDEVVAQRYDMEEGDRSLTEDDTEGFIKVVYRSSKLLGATIVAERAGEMIHEYAIAIDKGWNVTDLTSTIHVYPTYSQIMATFSSKIKVEQLLSGAGPKVIDAVHRLGLI